MTHRTIFYVLVPLHALLFCPVSALCDVYSQLYSSKVARAAWKLDSFARQPAKTVLLVDGSNLRGASGVGWDHAELQNRIESYCTFQTINLSILVWDHGSCPFAIATTNRSLALFSGLSQRADDVLVKEVDHLLQQEAGTCLAVVTNDVGLTARIRKSFDVLGSSAEQCLTLDSTRFLDILKNQEATLSNDEQRIQLALRDFKETINEFRVKLRYGLTSRREKTWERVVLAEVFRRQLFEIYKSKKVDDFILGYVQDLSARGFRTTADSFSESILFEGPSRLDKRQRKTLKRFDKIAAESTAIQ